jgi:predicted aspartyl protease
VKLFGLFTFFLFIATFQINSPVAQELCVTSQFGQHGLAYDDRGRPLLPVKIGVLEKTILLDTGSALSALEMDQVVELDLPQVHAGMTMTAITGESSSLATNAETFTLGDITRKEMRFMILPGFDYQLSANEPVGILALDFLSDYELELDFVNDDIRLFSTNKCLETTSRQPGQNSVAIPFNRTNSEFVTITALLDDVEVSAIIDTGAAYSILNLDSAARRFGIDVRKPDGRMVGMDNSGFIRTYTWQFQELNIGGIVVTEPKITLFPNLLRATGRENLNGMQMSLPEMIIGMDILRELHLYISFKDQNIYPLNAWVGETP